MKRIITHSGPFHSDDVMSVAALQLLLEKQGETYEVVRTRDSSIFSSGDYVVDVGGIYDERTFRYDHHQEGGAGARSNGIPYSSIGLTWKHHGDALVSNEEVWKIIDEKLIQPLDLQDNGTLSYEPLSSGVQPYIIDRVVDAFYPTTGESVSFDERFIEVVSFFKKILKYEIIQTEERVRAENHMHELYNQAEDKRLIVLDKYTPAKDVLQKYAEPLYVIYPSFDGAQWMIGTVRSKKGGFGIRKPFPEVWAGKRDNDFVHISGVYDAVFCHNHCFIAAAKSREGALLLAQKALAT